jgi:Polysaccharide pyruvyl transferase
MMNSKNPIGIMGCLPKLPPEFPLTYPDNSGNMVHANAPFLMFESAFYIKNIDYNALGYKNFTDFVNTKCSHLIITLANTLKIGDSDGSKYARLSQYISQIKKPVIVFGLGIQSKSQNLSEANLPQEAIQLINDLSQKCHYLGVRGEYTKQVIEKLSGIKNTYVTGCPSIFSNPSAFNLLRKNLKNKIGRPAYSGTHYHMDAEKRLLIEAIKNDYWLIEPVNKFNHNFYLKSLTDSETSEDIPYFLKGTYKVENKSDLADIKKYFLMRYKIFRNVNDWYQFNAECTSFTYGSRFHVNMASLISGKPALWLTHDARTKELVDFMCLPNIDITSDVAQNPIEIIKNNSYEKFFDNLTRLHVNFNHYLEANGLPKVKIHF